MSLCKESEPQSHGDTEGAQRDERRAQVRMHSMDGILVIDKPAGVTSHDVVARARRILQERRIGHTGTLDPFATGVLVLLVGRATRLAQFVSGADKEYEAVIRLGFATDTGDLEGTPLEITGRKQSWSETEMQTALENLRGDINQVPPMYSAKKRGGKRLYELARVGEVIEREPIRVKIHLFEQLARDPSPKFNSDGTVDVAVRVECSAGTYIRTLAEDFGKALGIGAHLAELRRTRAGDFVVSAAITLEQLQHHVEQRSLGTVLLPSEAALSSMPFVHLSQQDSERARNGMALPMEVRAWSDGEKVRLTDERGQLIGVGHYDSSKQQLHPRVVFAAENSD